MEKTIEIIICTEKGCLENLSKLLVATLRQYGGQFKDTPIVSYQPRKNYPISRSTKKFFDENNVEHFDIELNKDFRDYPLANKPLACAHREGRSKADLLIFLDSDVIFLNEPKEFLAIKDADVLLRPVGSKNIGSTGEDDPNNDYWQELYKMLGVKAHRQVTSLVDEQVVLEYYNSGHIVSKRSTNLYSQWEENFKKVSASSLRPRGDSFFLEQSTFGATVSQLELNVGHFSHPYNYPVYFLENAENLKDHRFFISDFDEIVSLHYHKVFEQAGGIRILEEIFSQSEKGRNLAKMIRDYKVCPGS